jgi:hypothetical protein
MGNGILAIGLRGVACALGGASQLELFLSVSRLADPVCQDGLQGLARAVSCDARQSL